MELDSSILFVALGALILQALILYLIIVYAVRPGVRERQLNRQIDLLIAIAIKQGVTSDEINEILERNN